MLDYATLRVIWWVLLGLLLAGFAIMDGFDLGVAISLPFIATEDADRRIIINTIGPVWEGNQVWIILGAGAIFAAWPIIYAVSFSCFYLAMLLLLLTFIVRPVAFKYRSKLSHPRWRSLWDWTLSIAAIFAALVFGIAVGNVLQGIPFYFDPTLRIFYTGSFWQLFSPFALLVGLISLFMLVMHGNCYLALKTTHEIQRRALYLSRIAAVILMILFALAGIWVAFGIKGYVLAQAIDHQAPSNPLLKQVVLAKGAWITNYKHHAWILIAPLCGFLGALGAILFGYGRRYHLAFISSACSVFGIVTTVGLSMFPFILPSSSNPQSSLLVWDASSSQLTLTIMLIATIVFLPIVIIYTSWVFWTLRGKVTHQTIEENDQSY